MKRLTLLLLAALMVVTMVSASLLSVAATGTAVVSLSAPGEVEYTGNSEEDAFPVEAELTPADGVTAIAGYEIKLTWDPAQLTLLELGHSGTGLADIHVGEGTATIAVVNAGDVLSGKLFQASFAPLGEGKATVSAEVLSMATSTGLIDAEGSEVAVTAKAPAPVENTKQEISVNENDILTDGKTGFTGAWGEVGTGDVLLITNGNCQNAGMDVTLSYALGEAKKIDGITVDLYHCAGVMIGYPEGQATVEVSVDGTTWTEVGKYDLAAAEVAVDASGTVSNVFSFDAIETAYVRILLYAGSSTSVLGTNPADGKIFWEFIAVAEIAVSEAEEKPAYAYGDVDGNGRVNVLDYGLVKSYCMRLKQLTDEQMERADVNGDGRINVADYGTLKKYIMNKNKNA